MSTFVVDPDRVTLDRVIGKLPKEIFQKSTRKALRNLLVTIGICVVGYVLLALMPWYCLPIAWALMGFSFTAIHSISHDCSRGSFSRFPIVNSIVGLIVSLPLLLPYESWRVQQQMSSKSKEKMEAMQRTASSWTWWLSSAKDTLNANFNFNGYLQPGNRRRIIMSLMAVYAFAGIFFPALIANLGLWGLVKFWLLPWLAYHFWMSTFKSWIYHVPFTKDMSIKFSVSFPSKLPNWVNFLTNDVASVLSLSGPLLSSGAAESLEQLRNIPKHNLKAALNELTNALLDNAEQNNGAAVDGTTASEPLTTLDKLRKAAAGVNWIPALWILTTPVLAVYGILTTSLQFNTFILAIIGYMTAGLGITVGYHRMFAHRAFNARWPTRLFILLCGTSAFEGSCLWWARDHRAHHRYVDTDKDPYNSKRGLFWAHMGWLLVKQNKAAVGKADCADLEADPLLAWQDKYYLPLASTLAIALPVLIGGLGWGDWRGAFFYAVICRSVLVLQSTFCVNSLAHYVGEYTFSDVHTPCDSYWVSLVTFGEGYHNFHHEFPYDFRNGVHWYAYDPSKWTIWFLSLFGLTYDLKRFPANEITKGRLQMSRKKLDKQMAQLNWGAPSASLPLFTMDDVKRRCQEGSSLIVIGQYVHDVAAFVPNHPGGQALIKSFIGKDATSAFTGGIYDHSNGSKNLLGTFRVGKLVTEAEKAAIHGETAPLAPVVAAPMMDDDDSFNVPVITPAH